MRFSDVLDIRNGRNQRQVENENGKYPIYGSGGVMGHADDFICDAETVVIGRKGSINNPIFVDEPFWNVDTAFGLVAHKEVLLPKYLYYFCVNFDFERLNTTVTIPSLTKANLLQIEIRVPDMDIQQNIVSVLDKICYLIELRQKELYNLDQLVKSRFIEIFGDPENNNKAWKVKFLDNLCTVGSSKRVYQSEQSSEGVPFWRISDLVSKIDTGTVDSALFISKTKYTELKQAGLVPVTGDILLTSRGTLGRCYIIKDEDRFYFQDGMISWLSNYSEEITPLYLQYLFSMSGFRKQIDKLQAGSTVAYLSIAMLKKLQVMVPDKTLQKQFAAFVTQVDKSKLAIQKSLEKLEILKKALMQKYFG